LIGSGLSAATGLSHKAMAADGVIVPCDGLIGLLVGHSAIECGDKLRIRESGIAQLGKPSTGKDSVSFGAMPCHVENDVVGYTCQPHGRGLACKRRQLIQADQLHNGTFFHSRAQQVGNSVAFGKDAMARTRQADQFDATLFAHPSVARNENLLDFPIVDLIFLQLFDTVGVHAGAVERSHIGRVKLVTPRR